MRTEVNDGTGTVRCSLPKAIDENPSTARGILFFRLTNNNNNNNNKAATGRGGLYYDPDADFQQDHSFCLWYLWCGSDGRGLLCLGVLLTQMVALHLQLFLGYMRGSMGLDR